MQEDVGPISDDVFLGLVDDGVIGSSSDIRSPEITDNQWFPLDEVNLKPVREQTLVLNPLVACPPAAAKSRARALTIGISLSIVLPLMFATGILWKMPIGPGVRGTGLAAVMTVLMALAAALTGVSGTLIARLLFEAVQRMRQSGNVPSPPSDP
jgi:hypothetical protein